MNIGEQIRLIRWTKSLSQKQLAEMIGISANAMCSIETGKAWPSLETMNAICDVLNVELKLIEK